ncbi:PREDICTED: uncharacterized protein LOC108760904 [Trachymyrmex cornetzi]|uniref:UPF0468 protein C16orf80 like protein n=1 Tax=Trachymyrmex cornetzi TaxID=471704 RepID=A0A195E5P8_9HYME|nr:PREDICTED: uncharacterized protein LOC108760904 [Trachymyrmex cornetzi]KYN20174.1 UPF0468 protein C16orf80 like protein [Trachymyrmex cornetzi]
MLKNEICGYMSLLYSVANKPLDLWSKHVSFGGKVRRVNDDLLHGDKVIEITGPHDNTIPTSITIPAKALDILNIKLPVLILVVKNLNLRFKLEVQIIDKQQYRRRFSFMTYNVERLPSINASMARIPLKLDDCWNFLEINLQNLCHQVYKTDYEALQRVTIYPNCHLRRVYLQDRHYNDENHVELYQAFFNMYMLKQGINFIEKSCQTEDCYTGPLEQSDLNYFVKDNSSSTSLTKVDSCKTASSMEKLKSNLSMNLNLYNSDTLKRNHMSLDALNDAIKKRHVFTRQSECFTKSLINDPVIENKLEKDSDVTEKVIQHYAMKTRKTGNSLLNIKINNHTSRPASSIELKTIMKSQFLKTHVSEIFKDNGIPKYPQKIQNAGDTYINLTNCTLNDNANKVQTGKDNSTIVKFKVDAMGSSSSFKPDLSESIKFDNINNNVSDIPNDGYIRSKHKYIKENNKSIANRLRSLVSIEEDIENFNENVSTNKCIPPLIEKETVLDEMTRHVLNDG